jgi:hypothetical protein
VPHLWALMTAVFALAFWKKGWIVALDFLIHPAWARTLSARLGAPWLGPPDLGSDEEPSRPQSLLADRGVLDRRSTGGIRPFRQGPAVHRAHCRAACLLVAGLHLLSI